MRVDLDDTTDRRSPSQQAMDAARNQVASSTTGAARSSQ